MLARRRKKKHEEGVTVFPLIRFDNKRERERERGACKQRGQERRSRHGKELLRQRVKELGDCVVFAVFVFGRSGVVVVAGVGLARKMGGRAGAGKR